MELTIKVNQERTEKWKKFLFDIYVTALEGGISYWADIQKYRWSKDIPEVDAEDLPTEERDDIEGFKAVIKDYENYFTGKRTISKHTIERALKRICQGSVKHLNESRRERILKCILANEMDANMDADDADCIVQIGLFGQVVFG